MLRNITTMQKLIRAYRNNDLVLNPQIEGLFIQPSPNSVGYPEELSLVRGSYYLCRIARDQNHKLRNRIFSGFWWDSVNIPNIEKLATFAGDILNGDFSDVKVLNRSSNIF